MSNATNTDTLWDFSDDVARETIDARIARQWTDEDPPSPNRLASLTRAHELEVDDETFARLCAALRVSRSARTGCTSRGRHLSTSPRSLRDRQVRADYLVLRCG